LISKQITELSQVSRLKSLSQKSHAHNPCEHQHLRKDTELGEVGFSVRHVYFVHKNEKEDTQSTKIKVKLYVVDLEGNHQNRTDEANGYEEDYPFGIAEAKYNRKRTATVFSVALSVFDVFDDFSDEVYKKCEYGISQHQKFGLLIIITDHPNGCSCQ